MHATASTELTFHVVITREDGEIWPLLYVGNWRADITEVGIDVTYRADGSLHSGHPRVRKGRKLRKDGTRGLVDVGLHESYAGYWAGPNDPEHATEAKAREMMAAARDTAQRELDALKGTRKLADMTPEGRRTAGQRAMAQLGTELQANAGEIGRIMDTDLYDGPPACSCCPAEPDEDPAGPDTLREARES